MIKPCPFCGGEAEADRTTERFEYCTGGPNSVMEWGYYVYCKKCGAGTSAVDVPPPSEEEAIAEWNRRVEPQWERVPDGTYLTKHGDGIISYGGDQLSISQRQKRMVIFVGTLPDGWELHRRVKKEPTP